MSRSGPRVANDGSASASSFSDDDDGGGDGAVPARVRLNDASATTTTVRFLGRDVTVAVDASTGRHSTTVWDMARCFLAALEDSPRRRDAMRGRRVLELGSGTGLLGIALSLCLDCDVTMTDLPEALPALRANVAANYAPRCRVIEHAFGDDVTPLFVAAAAGYDFVIGTDVAYSEALNPLLLRSASAIAAQSDVIAGRAATGTSVLMVNELRCELAQAAFERSANDLGLTSRKVPRRHLPPPWRSKLVLFFELRRAAKGEGRGRGRIVDF